MNEKFFLVNIDDEYSFEKDSYKITTEFIDTSDFTSLEKKLKENKELLSKLLDSEVTIFVGIDEHLPWDSFEGRSIFEGLGKFLAIHAKHPENIYLLGTSSNPGAQEYMPKENRLQKQFFVFANRPVHILENIKPKSVKDIFGSQTTNNNSKPDPIFDRLAKLLNS